VQDVYGRLVYLYKELPQVLKNNYSEEINEKFTVNIACAADYIYLLGDSLNALMSKYPNIIPNVSTLESEHLLETLTEKDFDFALCNIDENSLPKYIKENPKYTICDVAESKIYLFTGLHSQLATKKSISLDELSKIPLTVYSTDFEKTSLFLKILRLRNIVPMIYFISSSPQCCTSFYKKTNGYMLGTGIMKYMKKNREEGMIGIPIEDLEPIHQILIVKNDVYENNYFGDLVELLKISLNNSNFR